MISLPTHIKLAGALLLLSSLLLPLSSCESYVDKQGHTLRPSQVAADRPLPPGIKVERTYHYFFRTDQPTDATYWLMLAGFTWPAFMIAALARFKGRIRIACRFLEAPLLYGSFLALVLATLFHSKLEIGAYVAYAGIGAYSLGAVWADIDAFRRWKATKKTKST